MKKEKMSVKDRIQWYEDQGITEVAPLFHDPVIGELSPDEVNKYHDELCELSGNKTITNPKVIEAVEAAERGEVSEFKLPDPEFDFELTCRLPEGMTNDEALKTIVRCGIEAVVGIGKEGELGMIFTEKGENLKEVVETTCQKILQAIPGSAVSHKIE